MCSQPACILNTSCTPEYMTSTNSPHAVKVARCVAVLVTVDETAWLAAAVSFRLLSAAKSGYFCMHHTLLKGSLAQAARSGYVWIQYSLRSGWSMHACAWSRPFDAPCARTATPAIRHSRNTMYVAVRTASITCLALVFGKSSSLSSLFLRLNLRPLEYPLTDHPYSS